MGTKSKAKSKPSTPTRLLVIVGCHGDKDHPPCPYLRNDRTQGAGYAQDYFCHGKPSGKFQVDGYVEWDSEKRKPGDFPDKCPLPDDWGHLIKQAK